MENGSLNISSTNKVLTLEFSHPKGNSMPGALLRELAAKIDSAAQNPEVTVVVLKSSGDSVFCSGASFDELLSVSTLEQSRAFFGGFAQVIKAMRFCPKPIITRVQGKAIGGGVGIIAASDYAIALESASVRLSELSIGFGPFIIGPVVERKVGASHFQAMTLDSDWRDSNWCIQRGLFARSCKSVPELDAEVAKLANFLSQANPEALNQLKEIFWSSLPNLETLLKSRVENTAALVLTDFVKAKVKAVKEGGANK
jgi:methylglutaconyl-CoA hydratase